ncbi:MAG: cytochrome C oxidase Cbb3 [Flavobacteriaceae bacterium]|nr:MAG: cytochrome C oxidase Cbb3 [Flavobacteriaceae bacterium]
MEMQKFFYDNKIVKYFIYATLFWGVTGFFFGVTIATLLFYPQLVEYLMGTDEFQSVLGFTGIDLGDLNGALGFGRLRMIHTSLVIFAFVGNAVFAGSYYSMQRVLKTRMYSDTLSWANFWLWQLMIIATFVTFLMGINTSKEYAEHEWPIDIITTIAWVIYGINMFGTVLQRRVRHMYVAVWFYIGTFIGVALLHIFNNLAVPVSLFKSYSVYAGVQDAMVQWWYGHNAVAFFLTTPVLGLMYYFVPKASGRPVFSYKLSIIHFWSLIFVYIWAGSHHLLYTALPAWTQALGTAFSIMLIAPSWGGMLNGLLTLRGAWDKVRTSPVLPFFVVAVTCYGMATFEGPMLATKSLNEIGHFTDWVIAHVHLGTLGWNGFMIFGMIYYLIPALFNTNLYSDKLAKAHFWIGTLGILFYVISMYTLGFTQGLMWKEFNPDGALKYTFLDTLENAKKFYYPMRALGGTLYLTGACIMVFNVYKTVKQGTFVADQAAEAMPLKPIAESRAKGEEVHTWLERKPLLFGVLSLIVLSIGGMVEIIPQLAVKENIPTIESVKPYTPLELEGRDLYIREGCNACHTQIVRPFRDEVERYGEYSKPGEFVYDRPFLWGSKRTGPDLGREGNKNYKNYKGDSWHYKHLFNPRLTSDGKSIMPRFIHLTRNKQDRSITQNKMRVLQKLNVPYTDADVQGAYASMDKQAAEIEKNILKDLPEFKEQFDAEKKANGDKFVPLKDREIVSLIAYLQRLGVDISGASKDAAASGEKN